MEHKRLYGKHGIIRGHRDNWTKFDPILDHGQLAEEYVYDENGKETKFKLKCGDGETPWSELEYILGAGGSGSGDGSGDISGDVKDELDNLQDQITALSFEIKITSSNGTMLSSTNPTTTLTAELLKNGSPYMPTVGDISYVWVNGQGDSVGSGNALIVKQSDVLLSETYTVTASFEARSVGQMITIMDAMESLSLSGYILTAGARVQYLNLNNIYDPNYEVDNLSFLPHLFKAGSQEDLISQCDVSWFYRLSGEEEFHVVDEHFSIAGNQLVLTSNILTKESPSADIRCDVVYEENGTEYKQSLFSEMFLSVQGSASISGYTVVLDNEFQGIACDVDGNPKAGEIGVGGNASTKVSVFRGNLALSPVATLEELGAGKFFVSATSVPQGATFVRGGDNCTFYLAGQLNDESGAVTMSVICESEDMVIDKTFNYKKSRDSVDGTPAKLLRIVGANFFSYDGEEHFSPESITLTANVQGVSNPVIKWMVWNGTDYVVLPVENGKTCTLTPSSFASSNIKSYWIDRRIKFKAYAVLGGTDDKNDVYDEFSVYKIYDGKSSRIFFIDAPMGTVFKNTQTDTLDLYGRYYIGNDEVTENVEYKFETFDGKKWNAVGYEQKYTVCAADVYNLLKVRCTGTYEGESLNDTITIADVSDPDQVRISSSRGLLFKDHTGTTTLTATVTQGAAERVDNFTYNWARLDEDGNPTDSLGTEKTLTINIADINHTASYMVVVYLGDRTIGMAEISLAVVLDASVVTIQASNGTVFKNSEGETLLSAVVTRNGEIRTDGLRYAWVKTDEDGASWSIGSYMVDSVQVRASDFLHKVIYTVTVTDAYGIVGTAQATIVDLSDVVSSSTAPENPYEGMIWCDTSTSPAVLKIYKNGQWEPITVPDVGNLKEQVSEIVKSNEEISAIVETHEEKIGTLQGQLENINVGARNYLLKSRSLKTTATTTGSGSVAEKTDEQIGYFRITPNTTANVNQRLALSGRLSSFFTLPDSCIFSIEVRAQAACALTIYYDKHEAGTQKIWNLATNVWTKVWIQHYKWTDSTGSIYFSVSGAAGKYLDYRNPKLEKGTVATAWTQAPEDLEGQLDDVMSNKMYRVELIAENGTSLSNGIVATKVQAKVYSWDTDVTDSLGSEVFTWKRTSMFTEKDDEWNENNDASGSSRLIEREDVIQASTFTCTVTVDGISASSQITIYDNTDDIQLQCYITSNLPKVQIYDTDAEAYSPDWVTNPLTLIPNIYIGQREITLPDSSVEITWKRREGGDDECDLASGESVATDGALKVSQNALKDVASCLLTYVCQITYTDPTTTDSVSTETDASFSLLKTAAVAKKCDISGQQVFKYSSPTATTPTPSSIVLTATLVGCTAQKWQYKDSTGNFVDYLYSDGSVAKGKSLTVSPSVSGVFVGNVATVKLITDDSSTFDVFSVYKLYDGASGAGGLSVIVGNECQTIACTNSGLIKSDVTISVPFAAYKGTSLVAASCSVSSTLPDGLTLISSTSSSTSKTGMISFKATKGKNLGGSDNGEVDLLFTIGSTKITRKFSWSKSFTGATGATGEAAIVFTVCAPDGNLIENGKGTITLTSYAYRGTSEITSGASYQWQKFSGGDWVDVAGGNVREITVDGSSIDSTALYRCSMTLDGKTYTDVISLADKTDPIYGVILSTAGNVFKNSQGETHLICNMFDPYKEVDEMLTKHIGAEAPANPEVGTLWYKTWTPQSIVRLKKWNGTSWVNTAEKQEYLYRWYRMDKDGEEMNDGSLFRNGKIIYVNNSDVESKTTFVCETSRRGKFTNLFDGFLDQGTIVYSGDDAGNDTSSDTIVRSRNYTSCSPSTKYSLYREKVGGVIGMRYYDANDVFLGSQSFATSSEQGGVFTTPAECTKFRFIDQTNSLSNRYYIAKSSTVLDKTQFDQVFAVSQYTIFDMTDIHASDTEPTEGLYEGYLWFDTANDVIKKYTGSGWVIVNDFTQAIQDAIDNVEIGGRNYVRNSDFRTSTLKWAGRGNVATPEIIDGCLKVTASGVGSGTGTTNNFYVSLTQGITAKNVVVSFDIKTDTEITLGVRGGYSVTENKTVALKVSENWARYSVRLSTNFEGKGADSLQSIIFWTSKAATLYFDNVKVETGTKPTDWTRAPEDIDDTFGEILSDSILTPSEKLSVYQEMQRITAEYNNICKVADDSGVATGKLVEAYSDLTSYINPILNEKDTNSKVDPDEYKNKFNTYYTQKEALESAIKKKIKEISENVEIGGRNYILNSDFSTSSLSTWSKRGNVVLSIDSAENALKAETKSAGKSGSVDFYVRFIKDLPAGSNAVSFLAKSDASGVNLTFRHHAESGASPDSATIALSTEWTRYTQVFTTTKSSNILVFYTTDQTSTVYLDEIQVETGTKATDWSPAPEDFDTRLDNAESTISNIISDEILTPAEKRLIQNEINRIDKEKVRLVESASALGMTATNLTTAWNALHAYIDNILKASGNSSIVKEDYTNAFNGYYEAKEALEKAIEQKIKEVQDNLDSLEVSAVNRALKTATPYVRSTWTRTSNGTAVRENVVSDMYSVAADVDARKTVLSFDIEFNGVAPSSDASSARVPHVYIQFTDGRDWPYQFKIEDLSDRTVHLVKKYDAFSWKSPSTLKLRMRSDYIADGGQITISNLRLVVGDKEAGWSPAPEDVNDYAESTARYQVVVQMQATTKQEKSELDAEVTPLLATVDPESDAYKSLNDQKEAYDSSYSNLMSLIEQSITDYQVTETELKGIKAAFTNYTQAIALLRQRIAECQGVRVKDVKDIATSAGALAESVEARVSSVEVITNQVGIRYIRDSLNGSDQNINKHWIECQVVKSTNIDGEYVQENIASGKTVTSSIELTAPLSRFVNGNTTYDDQIYTNAEGWQWLQVDLGYIYFDIETITIWHYWKDGRKYNHKLEVSSDGETWYSLYDSDAQGTYAETESGKTYTINDNVTARRIAELILKEESFAVDLNKVTNSVTGISNRVDSVNYLYTSGNYKAAYRTAEQVDSSGNKTEVKTAINNTKWATDSTTDWGILPYDGYIRLTKKTSNKQKWAMLPLSRKLTKGETYTFSAKFRRSIQGNFTIFLGLDVADRVTNYGIGVVDNSSTTAGSWQTIAKKFTPNMDWTADAPFIFITSTNFESANQTIDFEYLKLEHGDKASRWSPAPEDYSAAMESVLTEQANLALQLGNFTVDLKKNYYTKSGTQTWVNEQQAIWEQDVENGFKATLRRMSMGVDNRAEGTEHSYTKTSFKGIDNETNIIYPVYSDINGEATVLSFDITFKDIVAKENMSATMSIRVTDGVKYNCSYGIPDLSNGTRHYFKNFAATTYTKPENLKIDLRSNYIVSGEVTISNLILYIGNASAEGELLPWTPAPETYADLKLDYDGFKTQVYTKNQIDERPIGGRNYVLNSDFKKSIAELESQKQSKFCWKARGNHQNTSAASPYYVSIVEDTTGTYGNCLEVKSSGVGGAKDNNNFYVYLTKPIENSMKVSFLARVVSGESGVTLSARGVASTSTPYNSVTLTSEWARYKLVVNDSPSAKHDILCMWLNKATTIHIDQIQVESSANFTDWNPAPEDGELALAMQYTSLKAELDGITGETGKVYTKDEIKELIASTAYDGRNYLLNTGYDQGVAHWFKTTGSTWELVENEDGVPEPATKYMRLKLSSASSSAKTVWISQKVKLMEGVTYTASGYIYKSSGGTGTAAIKASLEDGSTGVWTQIKITESSISDTWKRLSVTFVAPKMADSDSVVISAGLNAETKTTTCGVCLLQLEKGSNATQWSPNSGGDLMYLTSEFASFKLESDKFKTEVVEEYQRIDEAPGGRNYIKNSDFRTDDISMWKKRSGTDSKITLTYDKTNKRLSMTFSEVGESGVVDAQVYLTQQIKANEFGSIVLSFRAQASTPLSLYARGYAGTTSTKSVELTTTMTRYSMQFDLKTGQTNLIDLWLSAAGTVYIDDIQVETGAVLTDWKPAPEDSFDQIDSNKALIDNILSDSMLTPSEKLILSNDMTRFAQEYRSLTESAESLNIDCSAYETEYNALKTFVNNNAELDETTKTTEIDTKQYKTYLNNYNTAKASLEIKIREKINLDIASRNLVLTSGGFKSGQDIEWHTSPSGWVITPNLGYLRCTKSGTATQRWLIIPLSESIETDDTYTFSAKFRDYRTDRSSKIKFHLANDQERTSYVFFSADNSGSKGAWQTVSCTFKAAASGGQNPYNCIMLTSTQFVTDGDKIDFAWMQLTSGNVVVDWSPAPEDMENQLSRVRNDLDNTISDSVLTPSEKLLIYTEWNRIKQEYTKLSATADTLGIKSTSTTSPWYVYNSKYTTLSQYIPSLHLNDSQKDEFTSIVVSTYTTNFDGYYSAKAQFEKIVEQKIQEVQDNLDNLELGGNNILQDTDFPVGTTKWNLCDGQATIEDATKEGAVSFRGRNTVKISGAGSTINHRLSPLPEYYAAYTTGETLTFRCWVKCTDYSKVTSNFQAYIAFRKDGDVANGATFSTITPTEFKNAGNNTWIPVTVTTKHTDPENVWCTAFIAPNNSDATFYVGSPKLEYGSKPTDWSPSPEDTESQLAKIRKDIDDAVSDSVLTPSEKLTISMEVERIEQEYAKLSSTADTLNLKSTSTTSPWYIYNGKYTALKNYIPYLKLDEQTLTTITNITNYKAKFGEYYTAKENFEKVVEQKIKEVQDNLDSLEVSAVNRAFKTATPYVRNSWKRTSSGTTVYNNVVSDMYLVASDIDGQKTVLSFDITFNAIVARASGDIPTGEKSAVSIQLASPDSDASISQYPFAYQITDLSNRTIHCVVKNAAYAWKKPSGIKLRFRSDHIESGTVTISNLRLVVGDKEGGWWPAPEDTQDQIQQIKQDLDDAISDSILTPSEKLMINNEIQRIKQEYTKLKETSENLGLASNTAYTNYNKAYSVLINDYVPTLKLNEQTNTSIVTSDFKEKFNTYYNTKEALDKTIKELVQSVQDNLDNMEVGAKNMLRNSSFRYNKAAGSDSSKIWWTINNNTIKVDEEFKHNGNNSIKFEKSGSDSTSTGRLMIPTTNYFNYDLGDKYTFSGWMMAPDVTKITSNVDAWIMFRYGVPKSTEGDIGYTYTACGAKSASITPAQFSKAGNYTWFRFSVTYWLNQHPNGNTSNYPLFVTCAVCSNSTTGTVYLASPKFERGEKATDWSPAPEDAQDYLDDAAQSAQDAADAAAGAASDAQDAADDAADAAKDAQDTADAAKDAAEEAKKELGELQETLENNYIKKTSFEETASAFNFYVSQTNCNNLVSNSIGKNDLQCWATYKLNSEDSGSGVEVIPSIKGRSGNAVSYSQTDRGFLLKGYTKMSQFIEGLSSNRTYILMVYLRGKCPSISIRYQSGTSKTVLLNIAASSSINRRYYATFTPQSSEITLDIYTGDTSLYSSGHAMIVSDLMLCEFDEVLHMTADGSYQLYWQEGRHDFYTSNVKIDITGLTVGADDSTMNTKMTPSAFEVWRTTDGVKEKRIEISSDGTRLQRTTIEDDITIGGAKIIKRDNGMDFVVL